MEIDKDSSIKGWEFLYNEFLLTDEEIYLTEGRAQINSGEPNPLGDIYRALVKAQLQKLIDRGNFYIRLSKDIKLPDDDGELVTEILNYYVPLKEALGEKNE